MFRVWDGVGVRVSEERCVELRRRGVERFPMMRVEISAQFKRVGMFAQ
jgi:hypothetical protein